MPYIPDERKKFYFMCYADELAKLCDNKGDVTYVISRIIHIWVLSLGKKCYDNLSQGKSVLQDTYDCYVDTVFLPHERKKKALNGHISDLDAPNLEDTR